MAKFEIKGYNSYSGCDILVTARMNSIDNTTGEINEKVYSLGSIQTLSVSTHQDKRPVRVIGSANAKDYTLGQRTVAGSLVFAVFDQHFATEMFKDLQAATGKSFIMPDELPGLDITITFANEYGRSSRMAIYGVRIINEGQVMSVNDLYTENTYQFVALSMEPLKKGVEVGSAQSDKKNLFITHSSEDYDSKPLNNGENIHNINSSNNTTNAQKIYLSVEVEQPEGEETEGLAKFILSPEQDSGAIAISINQSNKVYKEIAIDKKDKRQCIYLEMGEYVAWYHNNGKTLSNTIIFSIAKNTSLDTKSNDAPIIENVTNSTIDVYSNNPAHTQCVCQDSETKKEFVSDIKKRRANFKDLKNNHDYIIYTKKEKDSSRTVNVRTLDEENAFLNRYKEYVKNNKNLLSEDLDAYTEILDQLTDDKFIYKLASMKGSKAKELMMMAIKYNNEFTRAINDETAINSAIKNISNIFGNTFNFPNGATKANIFSDKNSKNYFESSIPYPTENTYEGKNNTLYDVIGVNSDNVKTPKYSFFSFSDNDKGNLKNIYNKTNMLDKYDLPAISNSKLSEKSLKCLSAKEHKDIDTKILKAPSATIQDNLDLVANVDYSNELGNKDAIYYLCLSKLEETLDTTPFRKIKFTDKDKTIILNKYLTAVNRTDTFSMWVENENYQVISEVGFASMQQDSKDANEYVKKQTCDKYTKSIEESINKKGYLQDVSSQVMSDDSPDKDIHKKYAQNILYNKGSDSFTLIYQLYCQIFSEKYINKERFKKAIYNNKDKSIVFDNAVNAQLIQIKISKDNYDVVCINDNKAKFDGSYSTNIFYMVGDDPIVKSGVVVITKEDSKAYAIDLEVI